MAKKKFHIYITEKDRKKLLLKAEGLGYSGRGALSHFLNYIANQPLIFVDQNVKIMLKALDLT